MILRAAGFAFALVLPWLPLTVQAETACLTSESLKSGVTVKVKDGSVQTYRREGKDVVAVVPRLQGGAGFVAELVLAGGLHVVSDHRTEHEAAVEVPEGAEIVGGNDGGTITTLYRFDRLPKPGRAWQGRVGLQRDQDGPSIGPQPTIKGKVDAVVVVQPEQMVTLSGCPYRIVPVETTFSITDRSRFTMDGAPLSGMDEAIGQVLLSRRQIWFPDLGFAVITREEGGAVGWSESWSQGIIGLAAE